MIKQKQIKTAKATILVIGGLPEDTEYVNPILGDLFYAKEEGDWNLYMGKAQGIIRRERQTQPSLFGDV